MEPQTCLAQMACICSINSKAVYVHCNSHVLNLCVVEACSLPPIRNMNSTITETAYLEKLLDNRTTTVKVKDLCRTRWIYRHEAYGTFILLMS